MVEFLGYRATFLTLGCFALVSLALWVGFGAMLRPACAGTPRGGEAAAA